MTIKIFWYYVAMGIMISIIYFQHSDINELSGLVTDLNKLTTEQDEDLDMSRDYINLYCPK